jgi:APA family basic amino acid/polyamine antiporter
VAGLFQGGTNPLNEASKATLREHVFAPAFAVQLVYVSFAYAGWNTAGYLAGEFRNPQQDMPRAVIAGVSVVVLLYLGLNVVFLISAPLNELAGQEKVGHVAATCLFGAQGGRIVSLLIVAGLISTVSANLMSGPRVYEAMGADYRWLRFLSCRRAGGGPLYSIALQAVLAAIMLVTASFEGLLTYIGVTLSLSAGATVLGALVLRYREPDLPRPYRTWGFPLTPLVFLALESWMIVFAVWKEPWTAACGAATIAAGLVVYGLLRFQGIRQSSSGDSR